LLLRLRWPLGAAIALAFAVGQIVEALLLDGARPPARMLLDVLGWGGLGGLAVWVSLTWVSGRERRYQAELERSLREQQALNLRLQRANGQLELLSDVNRQIAESATLDEILDAALSFPQRLAPARAAALLLDDSAGPIVARLAGTSADELARLRAGLAEPPQPSRRGPYYLPAARTGDGACLVLPLHDGGASIGRIELYQAPGSRLADDELALLETIASEIAEAVVSARRRSREERAIYELERAVADERARIARDIHDGLAQSLAFQRMRVDLWLDWIASDPDRLRAELNQLKRALREQIVELRRAIFALRPVQFDELGFAGGLNRYIAEFAGQQGWEAQVDLSGLPPALALDLEATCFRIIQEGLHNAAKHSGATRVAVSIDQVDRGLRVVIRDNGRGFEPGQPPEADGRVGLRQMRERLAALRGHLSVLSRPGAGAELRAWLPLER
jgi:signal transduction histidine kinase